MQSSAPSWITVVRHLESSFASFANARSRRTCAGTSIQILAKFVGWSCESFDGFPCSFRCRSVWIWKLMNVRLIVLDTSGPIATNCGDVLAVEARKEEAAWGPSTPCHAPRRRRALPPVAGGASQCLTVSLLSLSALEHHIDLVDLDVFVNVDHQQSRVRRR